MITCVPYTACACCHIRRVPVPYMVWRITTLQLIGLGLTHCQACFYELLFCTHYSYQELTSQPTLFTMQNALTDGLVAVLVTDGSCTSATCTTHDSTATRKLQTVSQVHKYIYGNTHWSKTHSILSQLSHIVSHVNSLAPGVCRPKQRTVI